VLGGHIARDILGPVGGSTGKVYVPVTSRFLYNLRLSQQPAVVPTIIQEDGTFFTM
jgi:hypothetical protein